MKTFKKVFLEQLFQKLDRFEQALQTMPELKAAHDLCVEIEKKHPESEALIVGGAVRDLVMGKQPNDVDIATNVDTDTLGKEFKTYDIGGSQKFGIVGISFEGFEFEVAHFRSDESSSDHRRPDKINLVKSFKEDSSRRDFTINSLGLNTKGEIVDYQNGLESIKNKSIKTVGNPAMRFEEDYLRILRAMRFASRLGWEIEADTKKAMKELAPFISKMSIERITGELMKAATSGKSLANYIKLLDEYGILQTFLPEVKALQKFEHSPVHHPEGGAWEHTLKALESITSNNPLVNLAILFHDIGKTTTFVAKEDGTPSYNGHEEQSVELFKNLAQRIKLSNDDIAAISFGIANHMKAHKFDEMGKNKVLQLRQSPYWNILKQVMIADELARGSLRDLQPQFDSIEKMVKDFGEKKEFEEKMATFITGNMIMNKAKEMSYNFTKNNSKNIGIIKQKIRDLVFKRNWNITQEEVQKYLEELILELKQGETNELDIHRPDTTQIPDENG